MPMLLRATQVGLKVEGTEGTAETIGASDLVPEVRDPRSEVRVTRTQRQGFRGSVSARSNLHGSRLAMISFAAELVGGAIGTAPVWTRALCGAGFTQAVAYRVTLADETGFAAGFRVGNNATYASATVLGIIAAVDAAAHKIYVIPITGDWSAVANGTTLHVYDRSLASSASDTTSGATAAAGYAYTPTTETNSAATSSFTVERRVDKAVDGEIMRLVAGRCDARLRFEQDNPAIIEAEFTGVPSQESDLDPHVVGSALTPTTAAAPYPCRGVVLTVNDDFTPPVVTQGTLNIGNTVTERKTFTDADYLDSGHLGPRITERRVRFEFNTEYVEAADFQWYKNCLDGTTFPFLLQHSSLTHTNGMTVVIGENCQMDQDVSPGDTNGIVSQDLAILFTGDDNEVFIAQLWSA